MMESVLDSLLDPLLLDPPIMMAFALVVACLLLATFLARREKRKQEAFFRPIQA